MGTQHTASWTAPLDGIEPETQTPAFTRAVQQEVASHGCLGNTQHRLRNLRAEWLLQCRDPADSRQQEGQEREADSRRRWEAAHMW